MADATLGLMLNVLKPLGDLITTLPVGPEHPGMTAGPSFELFYENDYLMPHRGAAWALLEERLRETAEFCQRLRAKAGVTESLAAQLAPVGEALDEIANSLAAHFSDWGATSRYSQQAELSKEIPGAHLGSLLEHATELAAAFPAAWINDDPARRVADLFADAHHLFVTAAETAGIHGPDSPRLERVPARLVDSVLRPLSDTLARASAGEGPASQDQAPSREFVVDRDIDAQLSTLALAATRQRADLPTNSRLSAGLAEATACLQDLSIEFAPSEGPLSADVRLAQLRAIQHELGPTIQVTADGPYLATNATNVVSGLGVRLATTPQMALCRCGQSAIKPHRELTSEITGALLWKESDRGVARPLDWLRQRERSVALGIHEVIATTGDTGYGRR